MKELSSPPAGVVEWKISWMGGSKISKGHTAYEAHANAGPVPPFGECQVTRMKC